MRYNVISNQEFIRCIFYVFGYCIWTVCVVAVWQAATEEYGWFAVVLFSYSILWPLLSPTRWQARPDDKRDEQPVETGVADKPKGK